MDVRHNMWQNELLGGGLCASRAFLVIYATISLAGYEAQSGDGCHCSLLIERALAADIDDLSLSDK